MRLLEQSFREEWPSWLRRCKWTERFPVSTPLGALPDIRIQPRYKARGEIWVKHKQNTVINTG